MTFIFWGTGVLFMSAALSALWHLRWMRRLPALSALPADGPSGAIPRCSVIRLAERDGVDHVTLSPGVVIESPWAKAWHLLFLISLSNWFAGVNRDRPKSYVGIGAFNLVRASAYRQCGGYEALKLTVVDDLKLGWLLRRAGHRTRGFFGAGDVECHWGSTIGAMIKVMEENNET